jgi:hypothetical protein
MGVRIMLLLVAEPAAEAIFGFQEIHIYRTTHLRVPLNIHRDLNRPPGL